MRKKVIFFAIIIALVILQAVVVVEAVRYDPGLDWQVMESPHFSVYFYQFPNNNLNSNNNPNLSRKQLAQEIADIAEKAYQRVNAQLGQPKHHHLQKIAIIMEDFTDYALGFASTFPHRVIRISLTGPTAKSFDMKFKSWLKMVITHEYTHIAHYEMTSKLTTALRALFGQILTPNALQPIWSIEGLAVYNETKFTTGGRGIDTRYDMYLRMAALKNKFNTLDQINGYYLTSWPDGTAPYIYGQSLIHFIAQRYGEDKIVTLSDIFSCYPFFGFNYALKRTLGLSLDELYKAWKDSIKDKYETQKQNIISSKTLTKSQQLTEYNYWVDYPRWLSTPEEDKIAIRVSTPHSYPFIQTLDPSSSSFTPLTYSTIKNQSLIKRTYGRNSTFSISPDNSKIIYAKLDNYKQYYKFYDLYLLDLKTEKDIRLSEGLRARDPSWSPDPDNPQIVTVINQSGINNLALINIDLESLKSSSKNSKNHDNKPIITKEDLSYLTNFQDDTQLYQPSWSPNGEMIVLSAWHNGSLDIYSLDLTDSNQDYTQKQNDTLTPIFQDHHNDLSPCWSPDSKYIFFSSDRTGIYNIFAFSLSNKKLYQITNVLGGAFEPSLSPDGKQLAYIEYHASGYELHLMEINPKQWSEIKYDNLATKTNIPKEDINTINISSKDNYPIHPYNSLSSFWPPTYWIPAAQLTEIDLSIGFSSVLEDVLGFSSLPFTITYGLLNNNLNYYFNYYNYRYLPIINFYLSGSTPLSNQNQNTTDSQSSWWKEGKTGINIYFPSKGQTASTTNSRPYSQNFSLGYQYEKSSAAVDDNSSDTSAFSNTNPTQEKIGSIRLSYSYSDAEKYGFSFSPEQGQAFSLSYEHADKAFGGDYTFDKLLFDGRKFIPLPSLHHTLSLRLIAGHSSADILNEKKFNLGGHYSADNLANIDLDTFSLRGYKSALLEGNNLLLTTLEYRFPIANIERSFKIGPFSTFLERLSGSFFIDIGNAWESTAPNTSTDTDSNANSEKDEIDSNWYNFKTGIGVELKADFSQKFDIPFTVRLGAAKALSTPKGYDIYFALGTSF